MLGVLSTLAVLFAQAAPESAPGPLPAASAAPPASNAKPAANGVSGVTVTAKKRERDDVDPTEVVCHNETPIGSRFPQKVCARRQEVTERRNVDQQEVRRWTALRPGSGN